MKLDVHKIFRNFISSKSRELSYRFRVIRKEMYFHKSQRERERQRDTDARCDFLLTNKSVIVIKFIRRVDVNDRVTRERRRPYSLTRMHYATYRYTADARIDFGQTALLLHRVKLYGQEIALLNLTTNFIGRRNRSLLISTYTNSINKIDLNRFSIIQNLDYQSVPRLSSMFV